MAQTPSIEVTVYSCGLAKVIADFDESVTAEVDYGGTRRMVYAKRPNHEAEHGLAVVCIDMRVESSRWNQLAWVRLES